jgi:pimeloyl-ACP methyl ester carboxylesterase
MNALSNLSSTSASVTIPRWPRLLVLVWVAGLAGVPALAQDANAIATGVAPVGRLPKGFTEKSAKVNGVRINYKVGGSGPVVVLLHGYTQTSHMWIPLMPLLATSHTVIAPDLRGIGASERTPGGYDKKTMAKDIRELVHQLAYDQPVALVGHDIGLMVAYAYAAQYPGEVSKVVLMDAFLPGVGDWKSVWLMRDLWHFHFYGETPLALVKGRERLYFEHFWNDFAADKTKSIPEADRRLYAAAYARDNGMRAGFELFKNFEQDAKDFAGFSATKLDMPFLVLTGEKASGTVLIDQTKLVANNVKGIIVKGSGHWLMEEAPSQVIPEVVSFISDVPDTASIQRLTPNDINALKATAPGVGTSGVSGIRARVLAGDPTRPGLYTIQLEVPANTRIEAHDHPDDRVATVVSGTWYFGYGTHFDEKSLKVLPAGSFYTEPPRRLHFARTGNTPVIVHISGFGPTGTRYSKAQNTPSTKP